VDIYHIWCDLKPDQKDLEFVYHLEDYLDYLKTEQNLQSYRITRRKLGLGPAELLEFHIMLDFLNLSDLDAAFHHVATRTGAVESFHHAVNGRVNNVKFALYRDFPDEVRQEGSEKF
jgi:hypothetical protein